MLRFHPLVREPAGRPDRGPHAAGPQGADHARHAEQASDGRGFGGRPRDHPFDGGAVRGPHAAGGAEQLAVYKVTAAQKSRFDLLAPTLTPEMPGMTIIGQPSPDELAIWAKPTQHLVLKEIIEQLESEEPDDQKRKLIGYPVKSVDPASVLTMLQQLYPDAQLLLDPKANRLLAWTLPEEHASIQSSLEAIEGAAASDEQPRFEAFSVHTADAATITTTLPAAACPMPGSRSTPNRSG